MKKRNFGKTGEDVSVLGIGGFHLLEIEQKQVNSVLNRYLEAGGNYIETSSSYGDGASERKIARAVENRRDEYILATKTDFRRGDKALHDLDQSLINLETDHVDVWFMHAVQEETDADELLAPEGALKAAEKAREQGKIRFIATSGHGQPVGLLPLLREFPLDAIMVPINYYDRFNFPDVHEKLIPLAKEKGTAVIAMKAVGDGYLWRSADKAIRYALAQPVSHIVAGINSMEMLEQDLAVFEEQDPMSDEEIQKVYEIAPEYRNYVCRQCEKCSVTEDLPLKRIFELEGWYDRQMWDGDIANPENFSLRVRLGPWFAQQDLARERYREEGLCDQAETHSGEFPGKCRYRLNIPRKLKLAHAKLTRGHPEY